MIEIAAVLISELKNRYPPAASHTAEDDQKNNGVTS